MSTIYILNFTSTSTSPSSKLYIIKIKAIFKKIEFGKTCKSGTPPYLKQSRIVVFFLFGADPSSPFGHFLLFFDICYFDCFPNILQYFPISLHIYVANIFSLLSSMNKNISPMCQSHSEWYIFVQEELSWQIGKYLLRKNLENSLIYGVFCSRGGKIKNIGKYFFFTQNPFILVKS